MVIPRQEQVRIKLHAALNSLDEFTVVNETVGKILAEDVVGTFDDNLFNLHAQLVNLLDSLHTLVVDFLPEFFLPGLCGVLLSFVLIT